MKTCHMFKGPKITIVYIYAVGGANGYRDKAAQFVDTYLKNPPGIDHETLIVCNGGPANDDTRALFSMMPGVSFLERDDSGWDIGGYQHAAREVKCDLMVFFGGHTYFRRPDWLARMWQAYQQNGNTLYGATGHQGDLRFNVHPHVRTTAFWCHPTLLLQYPHLIVTQGGGGQRYEFEHGHSCFSNWVKHQGLTPWIVGFDAMAPLDSCDSIPNGYHQNDQSSVLVGDRLTMPPYHHCS